jgi:hypothetical protein
LGVWFIKLGIDHQRIQPGNPQQNGRHERMHRTLKVETTMPPGETPPQQQERFDDFRGEYNHVRPHQALGGAVPSSRFELCQKEIPAQIPSPQYPGHAEVRKVSSHGTIKFKGQTVFLSGTLAGEHVALEETDFGIWNVTFYHVLLGRFEEKNGQLHTGTP